MKKIVAISLLLLLVFGCDSTKKLLFDFDSNISSIDCTITAKNNNELIYVELKISNLSKDAVYIAPNNLPENSEQTKELFFITLNGRQIKFIGKMIKRAPFEKVELIKILPGESKLMIVTLNEYYDFTKAGEYSIIYYSVNVQPDNTTSLPKVVKLKSNTANLKIETSKQIDNPPVLDKTKEVYNNNGKYANTSTLEESEAKFNLDNEKNNRYWFGYLYEQLQALRNMPENQFKSNPDYFIKSPYYEMIIKGGDKHLPYIIEKLKERDYFMTHAMAKITKVNINGYMENVKKMKWNIRDSSEIDWWLTWWEDNKWQYAEFEDIKLSNIMKQRILSLKDAGDIKLVQNEDFNGFISVKDESSGKQIIAILGLLPRKTSDGKSLIVVLFENINDNLSELGRFYYFSTGMNMGLWYSETNNYLLLGQVDSEASVYLQWDGNKYVEHMVVNDY